MPSNLGSVGQEFTQRTRQEKVRPLGPVDTTRTVEPTAPSGFAVQAGMPSTQIAGSGAGSGDIYWNQLPPGIEHTLIPYGVGAEGHYFRWQLIGRQEADFPGNGTGIYTVPIIHARGYGRLGPVVGTEGFVAGTGHRFASTLIVEEDYTPGSGVRAQSTGGIARLSHDARGDLWMGVELVGGTGGVPSGVTGTGASAMNGLWSVL